MVRRCIIRRGEEELTGIERAAYGEEMHHQSRRRELTSIEQHMMRRRIISQGEEEWSNILQQKGLAELWRLDLMH